MLSASDSAPVSLRGGSQSACLAFIQVSPTLVVSIVFPVRSVSEQYTSIWL